MLKQEIKNLQETIKELEKEETQEFVRKLREIDEITINPYITIYSTPHLWFTLYMTVDELKEIKPVLTALAKLGATRKEIINHRDHKVYNLEKGVTLNVSFSGVTCRQEKVGTREVDIYETRCDKNESLSL